ncbi:RtcB family protein [Belnapia rosea]|uniref:RtcB family protein n=1 Tax=Belnapia rosea TaxID=938405 RepID=UPI00088D2388|nr:RtcB family protein [Belnapia rosea]SDB74875.1 tRNA-splicing ligase RtcB [Belnapia rosea]
MSEAPERRGDPFEAKARLLATEAGHDPDARIPHTSKPGRTAPLWTTWRDAARTAMDAEHAATAAAEVASLRPQAPEYQGSPLRVFGEHEETTPAQMRNCMGVGNAVAGVVCADGHLGYAQPVGGVIAYEGQISVSGVGFDIACGNMAVRLDTPYAAVEGKVLDILADIRRTISFGVGRTNEERVEHPLLELAGRYAYAGREWVVERVRRIIGGAVADRIHNHHNYAWRESHGGRDLWVVRKGATPAFPGQRGFVGGTMGDDAVILEGVESEEAKAALYSTVHGAGRLFGRKEAKRRFTHAEWSEWLRRRGVLLAGGGLDESPMAYRRLPDVLAHHAGTVRVLHTLYPFAVAMAGEGEYDPFKD